MEEGIPIYSLDLETRLLIDSIDFEERQEELSPIEREAFLQFKKRVEDNFERFKIDEKDFSVSLQHQRFTLYIKVLVDIVQDMERDLQLYTLAEDRETVQLYAAILKIACLYRYPFGLYDRNMTVEDYFMTKAENYPGYDGYFKVDFELETLRPEAWEQYTHPKEAMNLVEYFEQEVEVTFEDNKRYFAFMKINSLLWEISLYSNKDWTFPQPREFSYWEMKVILEDLLSKLRNDLRESHLNHNEFDIPNLVFAINAVSNYMIGIDGGSMEPVENIQVEQKLRSDYMNAAFVGASMYHTAMAYADDVRILGSRGHGVAAEHANNLIDQFKGKDAVLEGQDNKLNGADRIVDGEFIQTKYCNTGGKCISECFDNGKFRYEHNGKPMSIEVPKDKYDDAIRSMQERIRRGDMKDYGITDPEQAKDIVKKGSISYKTAQRIAKAGTVEGVVYDAATGIVHASQAFGMSVAISFAQSVWQGDDLDEAAKKAMNTGGKVFGISMFNHIATKQIGRTAVEKSLRPATDFVTKKLIGSKASAKIVNAFVRKSGEKAIHGAAAMNQLSKFMRGNVVTLAVTTAIMSSGSIYDAIKGRISGKQLVKNIGTTGGSVGGAAAGAFFGSAVPVVGTIVGGMVGGWLGGKASKKVMDHAIEDDSVGTFNLLKDEFVSNIEELEMNREELNFVMDYVFDQEKMSKTLKMIYAAPDKKEHIGELMDPYIEAVLKARPVLPEQMSLEILAS
ncbi:hypothetical protein ACFOZY_05855 [Chungangia koreensis]|uniref:Glycine zipper n=1 Tax=Chungangia koreensis TaxID=752657 RepID=A0ABV8X5S9_9LACT